LEPELQPVKAKTPLLGIEAWAEWERHYQESDALIAAWLGSHVKVATVARYRETNFFYWQHLERRARSAPPRTLSARALAAQHYLGKYHGPDYIRPSERDYDEGTAGRADDAGRGDTSLMERVCPAGLVGAMAGTVAAWFFAKPLILAAIDYVKGIF